MLALYNTALLPLRPLAELWAARPGRDERGRREWSERLARRALAVRPGALWLHGASVGEVRIVAALARQLRSVRPELPLAASAMTSSGRSLLPAAPWVDERFFLPLDFPGVVRRLLARLRPSALALVETELWPNLLRETARAGVPIVLLNARLAPGRMDRYRRWAGLYRPLLESVTRIGAQSVEDARRLHELGAERERVVVTGNIKYDLPLPATSLPELRSRLGLETGQPVFVAGSTAPNEVPAVLEAFVRARARCPALLLILAPRHLEQVAPAAERLRARGLTLTELSRGEPVSGRDVLLVDTLGELAALYQLGTVAFVGGSLVPVGGHNVLEPAAAGVPVLFGPHTEHFREPAAALEAAGAGWRVAGAAELAARLIELLADPPLRDAAALRASAVVAANRGAMARSLELVLAALDAGPAVARGRRS